VIEPRKELAEADVVREDGRQHRMVAQATDRLWPGSESRARRRGFPRKLGDLTDADIGRYS